MLPLSSRHQARAADVPQSIATSAVSANVALPAGSRFVVARAGLDPALAVRPLLLLPERRLRLQKVHHVFTRVERHAAMRAGHDDEHDLVTGNERADAMHDEHVADVEARLRR